MPCVIKKILCHITVRIFVYFRKTISEKDLRYGTGAGGDMTLRFEILNVLNTLYIMLYSNNNNRELDKGMTYF
jgi:hypothetical protein